MQRRAFIGSAGALAGGVALTSITGRAWAIVDSTDSAPASPPRLVVVFLRGAVDGLSVVIPHGDAEYYRARDRVAVARPGRDNGAIDLDGYFGLHPALRAVSPLWQAGHLAFIHAAGSPDPTRSHFDAQDYMESGTPGRKGTPDGWLNRLLAASPAPHSNTQALNLGETVPRILSGAEVVASMPRGRAASRPGAIDRPAVRAAFDRLYAGGDGLSKAYGDGVAAHQQLIADMGTTDPTADNGAPPPGGLADDGARLGRLMQRDRRIRVAFIPVGGWDTHANQGAGTGALANHLKGLGEGLLALAQELGPAFDDTVVVVMSEFGRTFRENGNGGTDHGHGNVMWAFGGKIHGGVHGDWPGLGAASLYEGRDLAVTTDFRDVLATVLERHLRVPDSTLPGIFPGTFKRSSKLAGLLAA